MKHVKKERVRAQHYVPQFYLRRFSNQQSRIWCYDKKDDKVFEPHANKVALETDFYELESSPKVHVPANMIEKALSCHEGYWAPMFQPLIACAKGSGFTDQQISDFSPFLVVQWMRPNTTARADSVN